MIKIIIKWYLEELVQNNWANFLNKNNLQDMNVLGSKFTYNDLDDIKNIKDVKDVSLKLELTMNDSKQDYKSIVCFWRLLAKVW